MSIQYAISQGDEEAVSRLLDADPTLLETDNLCSLLRHRPLQWAADCGQLGVVRLLVQRGANLNPPGRRMTALHWAAMMGREEVVAYLLENGADASTAELLGSTPLMSASGSGRVGVVRTLLQHLGGQGLDDRDRDGKTALHCAAHLGWTEVAKVLLLAGADPTIRDNAGRTPRAVAEAEETEDTEHIRHRRAQCVALLEWWEGELKRRLLLERARCLHDASTTQQHTPTAPVPAFLQARAAAGQALPQVQVVAGQQEEEEQQAGASGKRGASSEAGRTQQEEERHAVCGYVVGQLNEELFRELVQGFHAARLV